MIKIFIPFRAKNSSVSHFLHLHWLWVSVLITIYCTRKLLWFGLRNELIDGYNNKSLESAKKSITVVCSSLRCELSSHGSLSPVMTSGKDSSCTVSLRSNQRAVNYCHNIHATVPPLGRSCQANCYCSSQCSQLGKTGDFFSPSAACTDASVDVWKKKDLFSVDGSAYWWNHYEIGVWVARKARNRTRHGLAILLLAYTQIFL